MKFNKIPTLFFGLLLLAGIVLSCQKETTPDLLKDGSCGRLFFCVEAEDYEIPLYKDAVVGLFLAADEGTGPSRSNEIMVIGENGGTSAERDTVVGSSSGLLYAYTPYDSTWGDALVNVKEFFVHKDQSTSLGYLESDLMWAAGVAAASPVTKMSLSHAMSRIMIHLTSHSPEDDLESVEVSLLGVNTGSHVFLREMSLQTDSDSITDVRCNMVDSGEMRVSMSAVIPPQESASGRLYMSIGIGGEVYDYDIPVSDTFESGKLYVYALTFADDGLVFEGGNVTDWTDGENGVLDADPSQS